MNFYRFLFNTVNILLALLHNLMEHFMKTLLNLVWSSLVIVHNIVKQLIFDTITLFYKYICQLLLIYNSIEVTLSVWAKSFIDHAFLQFLSFFKALTSLCSDLFSFEYKLFDIYLLLLFVTIIAIGNALYYANSTTEKVFWGLFIIFYGYIVVIISLAILLILLHLKNIFCNAWYLFLKDYQNSDTYKWSTLAIILNITLYDFADRDTKKKYIPAFSFLLFSLFTHCFIYEKLNITHIYVKWWDPYGHFYFSLAYNVFIYEFLYFFINWSHPVFIIHISHKLDEWLDVVSPKFFIKNITPKRWLFTWCLIMYVFFILMGLI
jgi:hypothetical protein